MTFRDSARTAVLNVAAELEAKSTSIGILRSVDATESAAWLKEIAQRLRKAAQAGEPPAEGEGDGGEPEDPEALTETVEINRTSSSLAPKEGSVLLARFESDDGGQREAYVRIDHHLNFRLSRGDKLDSRIRMILWRLATEEEKQAFEELENASPLPLR